MGAKQLQLDFPPALSHFQLLLKSIKELGRFEYIFFFGLILPNLVTTLWLKWQRIQRFAAIESTAQAIDVVKSDVILYFAFALLGLAALGILRRDRQKIYLIVMIQISMSIATVLEVIAHNYFMLTGSAFDYSLLFYTVARFQELQSVAAAESNARSLAILKGSVMTNAVLPWLLMLVYRIINEREPVLIKTERQKPIQAQYYFIACSILLYFVLWLPGFRNTNKLFVQNSLLNVIETFVESFIQDEHLGDQWQAPVNTSLELRKYARKRNLVFIILESTRAKSTTLHNPKLDTTPYLNKLAQRSMVALNANSIIPRTSKSLVPIHCGIEPRPSIIIKENQKRGIPSKCIAKLLNEVGYDTAYFQTAVEYFEKRRALVKNMGHREFFPGDTHPTRGFYKTNYFGYEDKVMLLPSLRWHRRRAKAGKRNPFMVSYLTNTAHHNYELPRNFKTRRYSHRSKLNRYMNAIRYTDGFLEELIAQYKRLGLYRNTIFVITADHGEAFWEHSIFGHSNLFYTEGLHIPLVIHDPQRFRGGVQVQRPVNQIDILPTVIDMMGFTLKGGNYRGTSMLEPRKEYRLFGGCWHERICAGSISDSSIKYIHFFGKKPDEAYNMIDDPAEQKNIIQQLHDAVARKKEVIEWHSNISLLYKNYQKGKSAK